MVRPKHDLSPFSAARRVRSFDDIVAQIRAGVNSGKFQAGDRLPNERDLRGAFGVGRSTLREALRVLEAFSVIEIRPGSSGGIYIRGADEEEAGFALEALIRFGRATADDLAEFRTSFESETASWAARRAEPEDAAELERLAADFARTAEIEDVDWTALVDLDIEFHEAIARASKNQVRVAIMLGIHRALQQTSTSIQPYASATVRRSIGRELAAIAAAVGQHDPQLASERMQKHVGKFSELGRSYVSGAATEAKAPKRARAPRTRKQAGS